MKSISHLRGIYFFKLCSFLVEAFENDRKHLDFLSHLFFFFIQLFDFVRNVMNKL